MEQPKPCEHPRTIQATYGNLHFAAGELVDSLTDAVICLDCGKELEPGEQPELTPAELAEQLSLEEA